MIYFIEGQIITIGILLAFMIAMLIKILDKLNILIRQKNKHIEDRFIKNIKQADYLQGPGDMDDEDFHLLPKPTAIAIFRETMEEMKNV